MELNIKCTIQDRWVNHFLGLLRRMQLLGSLGSSRILGFYSDGDGDFRPKFIVDGKEIRDIEVAKPIYDDDCKIKDAICDTFFDAG